MLLSANELDDNRGRFRSSQLGEAETSFFGLLWQDFCSEQAAEWGARLGLLVGTASANPLGDSENRRLG